jgi:hypothetical protein
MPLFNTIAEIEKAIDDQETILKDTRSQMEDDFDYIHNEISGFTAKGDDYHEYIDPAPGNFHRKILDGTNRALIRIAIKLPEDAPDSDKDAASDGELFIFGALHAIDQQLVNMQEPPLREGLAWHENVRGWMGLRLIVHVPNGEKNVKFDCALWDPMHMTWESGSDGLIWAANKRWLTRAQVFTEYGEEVANTVDKNGAIAIDFWDREGNSIIVGGNFLKENVKHGLDHVPAAIVPVGSMPTILEHNTSVANTTGNTIKHRGESVLAAWRHTIGPHNEEVSFIMDIARRARDAGLVYTTAEGTKTIEDPYGEFKVIRLKTGESLAPIELPHAPPESAATIDIIERGRLEATLPQPISHGGSNAPESGIALAVRIDQTRSVYSPRTEGLARIYTWLCRELVLQTKAKAGKKQMKLAGFNDSGEFFRITTTPQKLDAEWFFDVRVEPRLPRDEAEEMQRAQLATLEPQGGEALLSYETAREDILKLRNPAAEHDKVIREKAERLPPVQITGLANALLEAGDTEGAQIVLQYGVEQGALPQPEPVRDPADRGGEATPTTGGGDQQGMAELAAILDEIAQALMQAGAQEADLEQILGPFVAMIDGGATPPEDVIGQVVQALQQIGAQELAQRLIQLLQAIGAVPAQPGTAEAAG